MTRFSVDSAYYEDIYTIKKCLVLSICISDYTGSKHFKSLPKVAIKKDQLTIRQLFKHKLDYEIIENDEKLKVDINGFEKLRSQARTKLRTEGKQYDGFIFVFSGHGCSDAETKKLSYIVLSPLADKEEETQVYTGDVMSYFNNSFNSLGAFFLGKPKWFIFDACRGGVYAKPVNHSFFFKGNNQAYHPDEDTIILQSNTQGYISDGSMAGSYLINSLAEAFNSYKFDNIPFDAAIKQITKRTKKKSNAKQIPQCTFASSKTIVFKHLDFLEACAKGNVEAIKKLIRDKDINISVSGNKPTGSPAITFSKTSVNPVSLSIVDGQAKVNKTNSKDETFFHLCCQYGYTTIVNTLVDNQDVDVNKPDKDGYTPFNNACWLGNLKVIKFLVTKERIDVNKPDKYGYTPFNRACDKSNLAIIKFLVTKERIDVNKPDKYGYTPFNRACDKGNLAVIKFLVTKERIDANKPDKDGYTPWDSVYSRMEDHKWNEETWKKYSAIWDILAGTNKCKFKKYATWLYGIPNKPYEK